MSHILQDLPVGQKVGIAFSGGLDTFLWLLGLYGVIVVVDGLMLQPLIMKRTARVPIWASLGVPILLSLMFGFWGLLLAAPLLAVVFAYRAVAKRRAQEAAARNARRETKLCRRCNGEPRPAS